MNTKLILLSVLSVLSCSISCPAQYVNDLQRNGFIFNGGANRPYSRTAPPARAAAETWNEWRLVDGKPELLNLTNWHRYQGTVIQTFKGPQYTYLVSVWKWGEFGRYRNEQTAVFKNVPTPYADGDAFPAGLWVKLAGTEKYHDVMGSLHTVRVYDHGTPCLAPAPAPLTPGELAAKAARDDARAQALAEKTLAYHQAEAQKGTAYGLLEMGKRHLAGDGVEKDANKARTYFQKACLQGSPDATNLLQKLGPF